MAWIDEANSDCCGWEQVTCNSTTANVINLSLYNMKEDPEYYDDPADYYYEYDEKNHWLLNVSLLVPFKELRSLNLSGNVIGGCLPNQGMFSASPAFPFSFFFLNFFKIISDVEFFCNHWMSSQLGLLLTIRNQTKF